MPWILRAVADVLRVGPLRVAEVHELAGRHPVDAVLGVGEGRVPGAAAPEEPQPVPELERVGIGVAQAAGHVGRDRVHLPEAVDRVRVQRDHVAHHAGDPGGRQVVPGVRREEDHDVPVVAEDERRVVVVVAPEALEDHALGQLAVGRVAGDPDVAGRGDPAGERVAVVRDRARIAEVRPRSGSELTVHCHAVLPSAWVGASIALGQARDQQRGAALRRAPVARPVPRHERSAAGTSRARPGSAARQGRPSATAGRRARRARRACAATARSRRPARWTRAATTRPRRARRRRRRRARRFARTSRPSSAVAASGSPGPASETWTRAPCTWSHQATSTWPAAVTATSPTVIPPPGLTCSAAAERGSGAPRGAAAARRSRAAARAGCCRSAQPRRLRRRPPSGRRSRSAASRCGRRNAWPGRRSAAQTAGRAVELHVATASPRSPIATDTLVQHGRRTKAESGCGCAERGAPRARGSRPPGASAARRGGGTTRRRRRRWARRPSAAKSASAPGARARPASRPDRARRT